jgi:transcriptional regulator with XRE-family HTH domain
METEALGKKLREAREIRELTLEEVSQETRIRAKFLEALEQGDYSIIPSRVQARGFLRNYACYLRLDEEKFLLRFDRMMGREVGDEGDIQQDEVPSQPMPSVIGRSFERVPPPFNPARPAPPQAQYAVKPPTTPTKESARRRWISWDRMLHMAVAGMLFVALAAGGTLVFEQLIRLDAEMDRPNFLDALPPSPTVNTQAGIPALDAAASAEAALPDLEEDDQAGSRGSVAKSSDPEQYGGRAVVVLEAQQRTWVRVQVDGNIVFEGLMRPGSSAQYEGTMEVAVYTANGSAISIKYNGSDLGVPGGRGQLLDLRFTPDGHTIATPAPTSLIAQVPPKT